MKTMTRFTTALSTACVLVLLVFASTMPAAEAQKPVAEPTAGQGPLFTGQTPPSTGSSNTYVAAQMDQASFQHTTRGHRLWLDIRFDLNTYRDVIIDYGDGTTQTLVDYLTAKSANVALGQAAAPAPTRWRTDHSYDLALTAVDRKVVITWQGQSGTNDRVETLVVRPQAVFTLDASPLIVAAVHDCDWHSDGDFTVTWDRGAGETTPPEFQLGGGESKSFPEFAFTRHDITLAHGWSDIARISVKEHDPGGSGFLGTITNPSRWAAEFKGVPPSGGSSSVVEQLGDHAVAFVRTRELGHECFVRMSFVAEFTLFRG